MASKKNVPAKAVREWFATATPEGVPAPGSRGRLHPETVKAFHKANPRLRYETGVAEKATITVKVQKVDSNGRKSMRPVTITTAEARAALGHAPGKRGRISKDALSAALSKS